jgi:DNA-directed RNA polymerase subunit M/transcription elongation factor TFIIS
MANLDEIRQQMDLLTDEELVTILRERDEEQWRTEVFDIVASILNGRGISPDKNSEPEEEIPDVPANLNLATVATYTDNIDVETDRLALEAKGLKTWVFNQYSALKAGVLYSVQLQVREEDFRAAMRILELEPSEPVPSSDLPAEIAEPPCPKCGSRKVMEEAEALEPSGIQSPSEQVWFYHCASCGNKWAESRESSGL